MGPIESVSDVLIKFVFFFFFFFLPVNVSLDGPGTKKILGDLNWQNGVFRRSILFFLEEKPISPQGCR